MGTEIGEAQNKNRKMELYWLPILARREQFKSFYASFKPFNTMLL